MKIILPMISIFCLRAVLGATAHGTSPEWAEAPVKSDQVEAYLAAFALENFTIDDLTDLHATDQLCKKTICKLAHRLVPDYKFKNTILKNDFLDYLEDYTEYKEKLARGPIPPSTSKQVGACMAAFDEAGIDFETLEAVTGTPKPFQTLKKLAKASIRQNGTSNFSNSFLRDEFLAHIKAQAQYNEQLSKFHAQKAATKPDKLSSNSAETPGRDSSEPLEQEMILPHGETVSCPAEMPSRHGRRENRGQRMQKIMDCTREMQFQRNFLMLQSRPCPKGPEKKPSNGWSKRHIENRSWHRTKASFTRIQKVGGRSKHGVHSHKSKWSKRGRPS